MIDYGQRQTDAVISQMDRVIADIYRQTEEELQKKLDDYLARFKIKDAIKCEMLQKGEITLEEYNYWRTGQIMIGKRWEEMRDTLAQDLHNSNNIARSVVYGHTPEVYALNHNYATFQVEKASLVDTSYTLYDRQTVERIMRSNPDLLPPPGPRKKAEIAAGKDIKWQSRQLQSAMTKSILAGDSIPHIAKRLSNELSVTNRKAAERYARTAATGAQNAGRVDAYRRAQDMGIEMEQEWLATLDDRTRHEHRYLDGQHVPVGEPFTVDGYELRFPGDPAGPGYLIWNCRCTLVPKIKGVDQSDAPRNSKLGGMTYDEWKGDHVTQTDQEKAIEAVKLLPDLAPGIRTFVGNPLKVVQPGEANKLFDYKIEDWRKHIDKDMGVVEVPVHKIVTGQPFITESTVLKILESGFNETSAETITILRYGDNYFLLDGNHRVSAAYLLNRKKVKAHVYRLR